ncbi:hypothetical protein Pth03_27780 [Planotetraspora thailandica]|uniref:ATP-grasp domain-containing protein n=1 Tax=Planotetraspora thailandica TaxID=487172 RepID=A0A8J3V5I3_9ACTN|nr:ATP-grasp domain-containing protein [Planotetraspora thailandica]GII54389.1 hypothetical protein Pth03_27780 [Planotetraspora thailandica]
MDKTILLVGGNDDAVRKAARLGLRVLLLQHPTKLTAEQEQFAEEIRIVDYTEWGQVERAAKELWDSPGFSVALSLTEPGLEPAGRINDMYGLGATGYEVTRRFRDKLAMRRHLESVGAGAVPAEPLLRRQDMDAFAAAHGYPFIVKPTDATASIGVFRVDGPVDCDRVWGSTSRLRGTRTDRVSSMYVLQDFMMEKYVEGPEYSVESFSFAGRHVVVTLTEKFVDTGSFAEVGHAVPARVPEGVRESVRVCVTRFLDQIGLRDGVAHTEVRVGPDGPVIIESHNRIAGDAIPELVWGAYGIDLSTYAFGWPFRLVPELPDRPEPHAGACTRFIVAGPGRVESVAGAEAALAEPGVLDVRITAKPGDATRPLRDNWDRLGLVAVTGADADAAIERGAEVIGGVVKIGILGDDGRQRLAHAAPVGGQEVPA